MKGSVPGMLGDGFASELGGIMEVSLCRVINWAFILLGASFCSLELDMECGYKCMT